MPKPIKITIAFSDADKSILFIADGQIYDTLDPSCKIEITKTNYFVSLIDFKDMIGFFNKSLTLLSKP